ncbi:hypothetical protein Pint_21078 [Pistacia integerrima]|uniref:Uncharacterized protein n=1 Tax=Pistacia integerrima TaxID=434235 RepID=A0ACC0X7D2_9ROSI|nr:hypothetical protein Pint_21078 [Pistacia integerrima]
MALGFKDGGGIYLLVLHCICVRSCNCSLIKKLINSCICEISSSGDFNMHWNTTQGEFA